MHYMVVDLEWNGSFSKAAHGYFNEIIEIGAVMLDEGFEEIDRFHAVIKPTVSRKITDLVSDLTNIGPEELRAGTSFPAAAEAWQMWAGEGPVTVLTWSRTDLSVLLENYRYFLRTDRVPFMTRYADLQAYAQSHSKLGSPGQQMGLSRACEALSISDEGLEAHRALDDARMTAAIARKILDPEALNPFVQAADGEFYARLNFRPYYVKDIHSPLINPKHLRFRCPQCKRQMRPAGEWRFHANAFWADMECRSCALEYIAQVQFRKKFDGLEVKRKLTEKPSENKDNQEKERTDHGKKR